MVVFTNIVWNWVKLGKQQSWMFYLPHALCLLTKLSLPLGYSNCVHRTCTETYRVFVTLNTNVCHCIVPLCCSILQRYAAYPAGLLPMENNIIYLLLDSYGNCRHGSPTVGLKRLPWCCIT